MAQGPPLLRSVRRKGNTAWGLVARQDILMRELQQETSLRAAALVVGREAADGLFLLSFRRLGPREDENSRRRSFQNVNRLHCAIFPWFLATLIPSEREKKREASFEAVQNLCRSRVNQEVRTYPGSVSSSLYSSRTLGPFSHARPSRPKSICYRSNHKTPVATC